MPTIDRQSLHFPEAVERHFAFLGVHGFERDQKQTTVVRFQSKDIFVTVYHGRRSFDVSLEIGRHGAGFDEKFYSISEIIRLVEPNKVDEYRNYSARTAEGVAQAVQGLAVLFRRYVDNGLLSDSRLFRQLQENRKMWAKGYSKEVNLKQARRQLDTVWHAKNYAKIVESLEPLRSDLSPTELKKLNYAKKQIARGLM